MNNIQTGVIKNEWNKVLASGLNIFGLVVVLIGSVIAFRAVYRSYVYATENISV